MKKAWTKKEVGILTNSYTILSFSEIGKALGRSADSVHHKIKRLGIAVPTSRRKNLTGRRYGRLIAIEMIRQADNGACVWLCQCDCGETPEISIGNWGRTKSCGCIQIEAHRKDLSGQLFGRLTAIEYDHTEGKNAFWKCVCACGAATIVRSAYLLQGTTKSCGNCQEFSNGKLVSFPQVEIASFVDGQLNYQVGRTFIDVALPEQMIAIEYNGWYWHKNKQEEDLMRTNELLEEGWKVIIIKSRAKVPEDKAVKTLVEAARSGIKYQELMLSDWLGYNQV